MVDRLYIRNFAVIAHIDHGKSTLCDRLIEMCGAIEKREMREQLLDSMDIERERGITIKAQTVRLTYNAKDGIQYILNIIDTPGHVDFSYEVSRSMFACEGSILVIDASQGIEAQTLANLYKAVDAGHEILLVLNKIDLPAADPEKVSLEIESLIGISDNPILISAKNGIGIDILLEEIVRKVPAPVKNKDERLSALLVDSWYDTYLGVIILVRIKSGILSKGMRISTMSNEKKYDVEKVGFFTPKKIECNELQEGEIGFVVTSIKNVSECKVGDTITSEDDPIETPLPGFKEVQPMVFCSFYPMDSSDFSVLKSGLEKLRLNDASFSFETCNSGALGYGFRCGFLGILHLEVIHERLQNEFNIDLIITAPSVLYKFYLTTNKVEEVYNAGDMPEPTRINYVEEPWVLANIMVPDQYVGALLDLCNSKRGIQKDLAYSNNRVLLSYELPLAEIIFDFYDRLKSLSKGYASLDWEVSRYARANIVKLDILVNSEPVEALAFILHQSNAYERGKEICERLKDIIPRQQYKIAIQAAIGSKVIARETINPYKKDVTAKLYGGDKTRKMKLLEKQKKGKKRMQNIGNVEIPQNALINVFKIGDR